jgi:hypothetical protein
MQSNDMPNYPIKKTEKTVQKNLKKPKPTKPITVTRHIKKMCRLKKKTPKLLGNKEMKPFLKPTIIYFHQVLVE